MPKLKWDQSGDRRFETGVDHGVLYPMVGGAYPTGVAWNGLTTVTKSPGGAEASPQYADNIQYLNLVSAETFSGTIEAFTYPDEFEACDGTKVLNGVAIGQQDRQRFGLVYRSKIGNDVDGMDYGYKLHIIYGALASPAERAYATVNDSPEAMSLSWEFSTNPEVPTGLKPTSTLTIASKGGANAITAKQLAAVESALFGSDSKAAYLPKPDELFTLIAAAV